MSEITKVGRPCRVCSSTSRNDIERRLLSEGVSRVSSWSGIPVASIGRHVSAHLRPEMREALRGSQPLDVTDLLGTAVLVAKRAQEVAERAVGAGNDLLVLKAGDATLRATTALADRFGIKDLDVLEVIRAAEKIATALGQISRQSPEVGELVATHLEANGDRDIALELRTVIGAQTKKEIRA